MLFRLRKGILWEDGVELTAEDVAFTYRLVIDPKTASPYAEDFCASKELNVLDRYTIEVIYEEFFARAVASRMSPILPKHILEAGTSATRHSAANPWALWPIQAQEWQSGSRIVREASETYFDGRPHIDEVILQDHSRRCHHVHGIARRAPGRDESEPAAEPAPDQRQLVGQRISQIPLSCPGLYFSAGFNLRHPFFFGHKGKERPFPGHHQPPGHCQWSAALGQGEAAFGPFKPEAHGPIIQSLQPVAQDVAKAEQMLDEAGFREKKKKNGLRRKKAARWPSPS